LRTRCRNWSELSERGEEAAINSVESAGGKEATNLENSIPMLKILRPPEFI